MSVSGVLRIDDQDRVRLLTLDRERNLNAFSSELYHAVNDALAVPAAVPATPAPDPCGGDLCCSGGCGGADSGELD